MAWRTCGLSAALLASSWQFITSPESNRSKRCGSASAADKLELSTSSCKRQESVGRPRASISKETKVNNWQKYQYDQGFRMCRSMAVPSIPLLNVVSYSFSQAGCGCFATTSAARLLCTSRIPYRSELRDSVPHAG